jgi:hypothetical protein
MSEFKNFVDKEEVMNIKTNLLKIRLVLEKKIEDKLEELIQLKEDLPHLIHSERLTKMEKEYREKSNE